VRRTSVLAPDLPEVCRFGLATRGGSHLRSQDVEWAVERGVNYLNWCGHSDGMSRAVSGLGFARREIVLAVQFQSRSAADAEREFDSMLRELRADYIDIATLYYVESNAEWQELISPGGVYDFLLQQKQNGRLRLIGLTSHQRPLAAAWAGAGRLDMLMVRYNAAHRGAENDVFQAAAERHIPVVTFTGLRWGALLKSTPEDPPGFQPPDAVACYRFCLANDHVAVALAAPSNRAQLEKCTALLHDWRAPSPAEFAAICAHGERVRRHAGAFW
jgi:predicted aldo/keto reductase-like oxidoreductase